MRHTDNGSMFLKTIDRCLDIGFGASIERRGGFVEDDYWRVADECSRDGNSLPLTAGQAHPAFANLCLITFRETHNKVVAPGGSRGSFNFRLGRAAFCTTDVSGD